MQGARAISRTIAFTFACLAFTTRAEAAGIWLGPQIAFPLPGRCSADNQLGVDAGLTFSRMENPYAGFGADVIYHYWPVSQAYKANFDQFLSRTRYQVIDGSSYAFHALQMTGHVRLAAPVFERHLVWVRVGVGFYRVNRNLEAPSWEGSPIKVIGLRAGNITVVPGGYGAIGFDLRPNRGTGIGLDANFHQLWSGSEPGVFGDREIPPNFSTFTLGMHVLFGR